MTELDLHAPDGDPWCCFRASIRCTNGCHCLNPRHRGASWLNQAAAGVINVLVIATWA